MHALDTPELQSLCMRMSRRSPKCFMKVRVNFFLLVVLSQTKYMYVRMVDGEEKQM